MATPSCAAALLIDFQMGFGGRGRTRIGDPLIIYRVTLELRTGINADGFKSAVK
jgi:hypothetical protein